MRRPPLAVVIIAFVYIAAGIVGFVYHGVDLVTRRPLEFEIVLVCLIRLLAIIGGVFLLRGRNWARWLLIGWMAYHVVLSAFHTASEAAMHGILLGIISYLLLRERSAAFFRIPATVEASNATEKGPPTEFDAGV
jgi:hypothetical protein